MINSKFLFMEIHLHGIYTEPEILNTPMTEHHRLDFNCHCTFDFEQTYWLRASYLQDVYVLSHFNCVQPFATPRTADCQAPLSWGFPGKNTGVGCHALFQGIFPTRDQTQICYIYLHWQEGSLSLVSPGKPIYKTYYAKIIIIFPNLS